MWSWWIIFLCRRAAAFKYQSNLNFQTDLKSKILCHYSKACLNFSENWLNVLMVQQFKDFFSLCLSLLSIFTVLLICIWCFSCNTAFVFKKHRICYGICIMIISREIILLISIAIPLTAGCFSIVFTVCS